MADVLVNDETNEAVFLNEATNAWVPSKLLANEAGKRIAWDGYSWVPVRDKPKPEKPVQKVYQAKLMLEEKPETKEVLIKIG